MNPHDRNDHKILSLARLPVPTLPHIVCSAMRLSYNTKLILSCQCYFLIFLFLFYKFILCYFLLPFLKKHDKIIFVSFMQEWRNWQTRRLQVPVVAISCGFKSHFLHLSEAEEFFLRLFLYHLSYLEKYIKIKISIRISNERV